MTDKELYRSTFAKFQPSPETRRTIMNLTPKAGRASRRLRTALIAAVACLVLAGTAFAAVYLMTGREALEQIFCTGTYDWSASSGHQYSQEFLDMFDETYVTRVDQTVQSGDMDITLVSVVGAQDDHCLTLGYLLRFTLPEGVTLDPEIVANSGYGFLDVDEAASAWDGQHWTRYNPWELEPLEELYLRSRRHSVYLLETEEPNTWYGYLSEVHLNKQLFEFFDGRMMLELGSLTDGTDILAEGHWLFTFQAADLPQARQLIGQPLATADGHGEVTSLTVSPLGIDVELVRDGMFMEDEEHKAWLDCTAVSLVMADDTVEPLTHVIGNGGSWNGGVTYRQKWFYFFDAPIDLEQVAAVRIGETELPLR